MPFDMGVVPFSFSPFCVMVMVMFVPLHEIVIIAVRSAPVVLGVSVMVMVYVQAASPWSGEIEIQSGVLPALVCADEILDVQAPVVVKVTPLSPSVSSA